MCLLTHLGVYSTDQFSHELLPLYSSSIQLFDSEYAAHLLHLYLHAVSMALKLHCERTQVTRTTPRLWYDRFINYHPRIILTDAVLKDLVDGLDFGRLLYLPKEVHFSFHHMMDLVVSERCVRPFKHIR